MWSLCSVLDLEHVLALAARDASGVSANTSSNIVDGSRNGPSVMVPYFCASFHAAVTSALSSSSSASCFSSDQWPSVIRCCLSRSMGSPSGKPCPIRLWAVLRRIVARRVRAAAVGNVFDQRRAAAASCAVGRPERYRINGQQVVAVNADARECRGRGRALRTGAVRRRQSPGRSKWPTGC